MDELIKSLSEHKVYVDMYKTHMIPVSTVERLLQEHYNKNLNAAFDSISEELLKVENELKNLTIND